MSRILVVGLCCVDVVLFADKFPFEDSDTRIYERVNFYIIIINFCVNN